MAINHQEQKADKKEIPTKKPALPQCKKCNKSFKWKSCLQAHMKKCAAQQKKGANKRKATLKAIGKIQEQIVDLSSEDDVSSCQDLSPLTKIRRAEWSVAEESNNVSSTRSRGILKVHDEVSKTQVLRNDTHQQNEEEVNFGKENDDSNLFTVSSVEKLPITTEITHVDEEQAPISNQTSDKGTGTLQLKTQLVENANVVQQSKNDTDEEEHYFIVQQHEGGEEISTPSQMLPGQTMITIPVVDETSGSKEPVLMQVHIQQSTDSNPTAATTDALVETLMNLGANINTADS